MQIAEEEAHKLKKIYFTRRKNSYFRANYKRTRKNNNVLKGKVKIHEDCTEQNKKSPKIFSKRSQQQYIKKLLNRFLCVYTTTKHNVKSFSFSGLAKCRTNNHTPV